MSEWQIFQINSLKLLKRFIVNLFNFWSAKYVCVIVKIEAIDFANVIMILTKLSRERFGEDQQYINQVQDEPIRADRYLGEHLLLFLI